MGKTLGGSLFISSKKHGTHEVLYDEDDHDAVVRHKWYPHKSGTTYYAATRIYDSSAPDGRFVFMHNLLMNRKGIDHRNHNGLDNRRNNLREATQKENTWNQSKKSNNKSGWKGVFLDKGKGKYEAYITVNYKRISGGYYNNPIDAAKKYNELAAQHYGDFACMNIISLEDEQKYSHIKGRIISARRDSTTKYRGVGRFPASSSCKKPFYAKIKVGGKQIHLGSFDSDIEAAIAYNNSALKYLGDNALLNKIPNE